MRRRSKADKTRDEIGVEARAVREEMSALIRKVARGAGTINYSVEEIRMDLCLSNIEESRRHLDRLFVLACDLRDIQDELLEENN